MSELKKLESEIRAFADARNWEIFHTPKNLSMAIAGEAGELVSEFQWLTPEESLSGNLTDEKRQDVAMEIADVAIYLFRLVDVLNLDLAKIMREKIDINQNRF